MTRIACSEVEIVNSRWNVAIAVKDDKGETIETFFASADRGLTEGSGIWFGTAAEYDEASAW